MKSLISIISALLGERTSRYNLLALLKLVLVLIGLITIYSVIFHVLMEREGQHHSWITGFYWTLTVMSTLGFGDITFESDAGRLFSIIVLVTGVMQAGRKPGVIEMAFCVDDEAKAREALGLAIEDCVGCSS